MRSMLIGLLVAIAVMLAAPKVANAGTFGRYGLGVFNSAQYSRGETKLFSLGYEQDWVGPFIYQYEAGMYNDTGPGRGASGFGNISAGVEVAPGYLILRSLWGVGAITTPDDMLGGWFQFNQDFLIGLRDITGNMIGLDYKHISSAGIYSPNRGRDFLVVQVEIPW